MAYGTKYDCSWYDNQNRHWKAEIKESGYSGAITTVNAPADPLMISWRGSKDKFNPVIPSTAELRLWAETNYQFRDLINANEEQFELHVSRYDASWRLIWVGNLVPDISHEDYTGAPYQFTVKAVDGLTRLSGIIYDNAGTPYSGVDKVLDILLNALNKVGSISNNISHIADVVNIYDNSMSSASGDSCLNQLYLDEDVYSEQAYNDKPENYAIYPVKDNCKALGARCFMAYNETANELMIWFIRVFEMDGTYTVRYFDLSGTMTSSTTLDPFQSITTVDSGGVEGTDTIMILRDHFLEWENSISKVEVKFDPQFLQNTTYSNIIPHGEFELRSPAKLSDWNSSTSLKQWTKSAVFTTTRQALWHRGGDSQPFTAADNYGVEITGGSYGDYIENATGVTIQSGYSGTNKVVLYIRCHYEVTSFTSSTVSGVIQAPKIDIQVKIGSNYLKKGTAGSLTWTTTPTTISYTLPAEPLFDKSGYYSEQNFANIFIIADAPTTGTLTVRLYELYNPNDSNNQTRTVGIVNGNPVNEPCKIVYHYIRCNVGNSDLEFGHSAVEYIGTQTANITTPAYLTSVKHGDAQDGEGFNVGCYRLSSGAPTDVWNRRGKTDNKELLAILAQEILNNYRTPTLRISGTLSAPYIYPYQVLRLPDNSTTVSLVISQLTYNVQKGYYKIDAFENDTTNTSLTADVYTDRFTPSSNQGGFGGGGDPNSGSGFGAGNQFQTPIQNYPFDYFMTGSQSTAPTIQNSQSAIWIDDGSNYIDGGVYFKSKDASGNEVISGIGLNVLVKKSANYTATLGDEVILVDAISGAITITLPVATKDGKTYTIGKIDSSGNIVTVTSTSSINGAVNYTLSTQYAKVTVIMDGTNYLII